jgi:hypothetical protein
MGERVQQHRPLAVRMDEFMAVGPPRDAERVFSDNESRLVAVEEGHQIDVAHASEEARRRERDRLVSWAEATDLHGASLSQNSGHRSDEGVVRRSFFRMPGVPFPWTYGEAVKIDRTWKVSAQTWRGTVRVSGSHVPAGDVGSERGANALRLTDEFGRATPSTGTTLLQCFEGGPDAST